MKLWDWHRFLTEQLERHGKKLFTVTELANAAHTSRHSVNTELGRLIARGLVRRYAQGVYGLSGHVNPEDIVQAVDPGAYITGFHSLFINHLVTQVPAEISCFTNRRHNRKARAGDSDPRFRFVHVPPSLYSRPKNSILASPEQALCDFTWLCVRNGLDPRTLVTFRNLSRLSHARLERFLKVYPDSTRTVVGQIVRHGQNGA